MLQRKEQRWDGQYPVYSGALTEEEMMYRDYFETDLDKDQQNDELDLLIDEQQILQEGEYNFDHYDFQEMYTHTPEEDQSSLAAKMAFRFKYRAANVDPKTHVVRQKRMIARQVERFNEHKIHDLLGEIQNGKDNLTDMNPNSKEYHNLLKQVQQNEAKYYNFTLNEAVQ